MKQRAYQARRRAWLCSAAAVTAAAGGMIQLRTALAAGTVEPGVARFRGDVRINGKPADRGQMAVPGDLIVTGKDADLVVVVKPDAFLVRANSPIEFGSVAGK